MHVVAISRNGKVIIPRKTTDVYKDDFLYVVGEKSRIVKLCDRVHDTEKYNRLQKVMILGGGKTGLYLSQKLSEFGISVKIIEKDKARCQYLSDRLDNVLILHGDATDITLLEEENLDEMDAVVTATGFDEENLLLALIAKQHGVEDVIAKVSRESYTTLIESIGINMALNPLDMASSHILRFIQGSKRVLFSQLIQGQAEMIEIIADDHMRIANKPLVQIGLPDGVVIAAIHRGNNVIIPDGLTVIQKNDKVIIISLLSSVTELERFIRPGRTGLFA
jgi:trk system potassium uptake protein TrkA